MDRKLNFVYPAIIDAFSGVAGNISVQLNYKGYTSLIIANHFLVTYYHDSKCSGFNWRHYNDDYGHFIDMHELVIKRGLVSALIEVINLGFYVHIVLDHFYIKGSQGYQNKHFLHDCATILGYNSEKEIFYTADNFISGKFQVLEVSYHDIVLSRKGIEDKIIEKFYFNNDIYYNFTINKLKSLIRGYLDGKYYDYIEETDSILEVCQDANESCGLSVYEVLLKQTLDLGTKNYSFDVRNFHVMLNHMNIGVLLINWMLNTHSMLKDAIEKNDYLKLYTSLANNMMHARNLYIKLSIKYTPSGKEKLLDLVKLMRSDEKKLLESLYMVIDDTYKE
jgi:hypothetical protein